MYGELSETGCGCGWIRCGAGGERGDRHKETRRCGNLQGVTITLGVFAMLKMSNLRLLLLPKYK